MTTVATDRGQVRGTVDVTVSAFHGIPFAAPPTDRWRFTPPRPHPGWTGVRDTTSVGPQVPQLPLRVAQATGPCSVRADENECLNLTVWTPTAALTDGKPRGVLLWFHGGAFVAGSGNWSWYDGARLAALGDIVVITANYRLGPLGYLRLPEIGADNLGLRDQAAALEWVVGNVAAFGGDPARITVGGQSAGAYSALYLALHHGDAGPIKRIICQSGPFGLPPQDPSAADEMARRYLELVDVPSADALRDVPAERLLKAYADLAASVSRLGDLAPPMYPVLGGWGVPAAWSAAELGDIDVLLGTTADEMALFYAYDERVQNADRALAVQTLGSAEVYDEYAARLPDATPARILTTAVADRVFHDDTMRIAARCAEHGRPAYVYRFDRAPGDAALGAAHCAELPYLFGTFDAFTGPLVGTPDEADLALSRAVGQAFAEFVTTGSPGWTPGEVHHFG